MNTIKEWQQAVYDNAKAHGFHEGTLNVPGKLCLIHSKVSEALESNRAGEPTLYFVNKEGMNTTDCYLWGDKPEGIAAELADVVICVMDLCGALGIDLEAVIRFKHEYNVKRPYKHGKRY